MIIGLSICINTIIDFVNKYGKEKDAKYNNILKGSKLLVNMTLIDREIGINYSQLIKNKEIEPRNILKTQPLVKDAVKKEFKAIGFFENQVKIIKNAPKIKITKKYKK
jgi:Na+-transporting NADH:ubiquinone oxidoreductase subunit NqrA